MQGTFSFRLKGPWKTSKGNECLKEINDLKQVISDQFSISELKKSTQNVMIMVIDALEDTIPIAKISRSMGISRSFIYHRRSERSEKRRAKIPEIWRAMQRRSQPNLKLTVTGGYIPSSDIEWIHNL